jgi:hypothetical protein
MLVVPPLNAQTLSYVSPEAFQCLAPQAARWCYTGNVQPTHSMVLLDRDQNQQSIPARSVGSYDHQRSMSGMCFPPVQEKWPRSQWQSEPSLQGLWSTIGLAGRKSPDC